MFKRSSLYTATHCHMFADPDSDGLCGSGPVRLLAPYKHACLFLLHLQERIAHHGGGGSGCDRDDVGAVVIVAAHIYF